jgi:hypothetical protein
MHVAKRYDVTVFNADVNLRDFYISTISRPYWETDSGGISVFVEEYEQVLFVKDGYYSGVAVEVEEIDGPESTPEEDTPPADGKSFVVTIPSGYGVQP